MSCGDIGTLKWHIVHVLLKLTPSLTVYDVIILCVEYAKDKYFPYWKLLNVRDNYF